MAEVIAPTIMLSDSAFKTRPHFKTYLQTDANAGGNTVQMIEDKRRQRQMKFPCLVGRGDVDSFKNPQNPTDQAFVKYNDEGDYRATVPYRFSDNIVDPISGFVSISGDLDRNTGHDNIHGLMQHKIPTTPQSNVPQEMHSIRVQYPAAPHETRRVSQSDPGTPYEWRDRKLLDGVIRGHLGGWTSDKDPRIVEQEQKGLIKPKTAEEKRRDELALRHVYTSSTQKAYDQVNWKSLMPSRRWAPVSTLEDKPDQVSQVFTKLRYEPAAKDWQVVGDAWDKHQTRRHDFKTGIPIPGTNFCSPCPRARQIPLYGGCIGATNILEIDNANESFQPFTVKRVNIPRATDTAHRPNIPKYTGCTWYSGEALHAAHSNSIPPEPQTTARSHRYIPPPPNTSEHARDSAMSKIVTLVPPNNPYKRVIPKESQAVTVS